MTDGWIRVASYSELPQRAPHGIALRGRDLIAIRFEDQVTVLSGRCPHRGARLANAKIEGDLLVCA